MTAQVWDQRYAREGYVYGTEPNAFLRSQGWRLRPGMTALVLADGEGRNGVWLAGLGLDVTSVDQSAVGLEKAQALAADCGVTMRTVQADLAEWTWPDAQFDAVVLVFAHFPPQVRNLVHRQAVAALKPGGFVILEAFRPAQLNRASGGPKSVDLLYEPETLAADFAGLDVLERLEGTVLLAEGPQHSGPGEVVRILAQRPA